MSNEDRARLVRDIFATEVNEIQCEQAAVEMVRATAVVLDEDGLKQQYPQLYGHLGVCVNCAAEYGLLREMVVAEQAGEETVVGVVPARPDGRPRVRERLDGMISAVFGGFGVGATAAVTRGVSLGVDPVDVDLPEGELAVTLDVDVNEQDGELRNLFVTVMPRVEMMLEGVTMGLWAAEQAHLIGEATLDRLGDGAFLGVPPGGYDVVWLMGERGFLIEGVVLP